MEETEDTEDEARTQHVAEDFINKSTQTRTLDPLTDQPAKYVESLVILL